MPKDKGFKRVVRQRAKQSGQKYTAVRAELDRREESLPDDVVPGWSFIGNVVIHSHHTFDRPLAEFYAALLGMRILREDWLKVGILPNVYPQLAFEGRTQFEPPRWADPEHPQQLHLDIAVPDLDEGETLVIGLGAKKLQEENELRVFADPFGHQFCLTQGEERRIQSVVIDCFSPRVLATFYEKLLGMRRVEDTPALVVSSKDEHPNAPMLTFQQSLAYVPPRWPRACGCNGGSLGEAPNGGTVVEAQMHLDLWFEDAKTAREIALRLGAVQAGTGPAYNVFADPAGHPFCILAVGE